MKKMVFIIIALLALGTACSKNTGTPSVKESQVEATTSTTTSSSSVSSWSTSEDGSLRRELKIGFNESNVPLSSELLDCLARRIEQANTPEELQTKTLQEIGTIGYEAGLYCMSIVQS